MTALNFPTSPSNGDIFDNYFYDGIREVWRIQPNIPGISSRFKVSATAPENPANGEIWLNSTDGNTYIYYADVDSAQWIEIGGTSGFPPDLDSLNDVTITSPTTDQLLRWNGTAWVNGTANTNSIADGAVTAPKLANTAGAVMVFDDATARTTAIPTPVEGMVTYLKDTDEVEKFDGAAFVGVATPPAILQVVQTVKTDSFTESVGGGAFGSVVPSLGATITPSATSSKILVTVALGATNGISGIKLTINGTDSTYIGDTAGSRGRASSSVGFGTSTTIVFLHSPGSTSAQTYNVKLQNQETGTTTIFMNISSTDQLRAPTTASSITLMEVAG